MAADLDVYSPHYAQLATDVYSEVRRETYDEDLGQSSWITAAEAREWFALLQLHPGKKALEIACGSGGMTCTMAKHTGANCVGTDINTHGIEAARQRADREGLASLVSFQVVDAAQPLPFGEAAFDAVFCNDAMNHLPDRLRVLRDWNRVLSPGGRVFFTDPVVVTGAVTKDELSVRSSIGFFLFAPAGENERLLQRAGLKVLETRDVTDAVASVSRKWHDGRAKRRKEIAAIEGEEAFEKLQRFLSTVHLLSSERRLSRFAYLAEKSSAG